MLRLLAQGIAALTRRRDYRVGLGVFCALVLLAGIYAPVWHGAPLWDDTEALFGNPLIRSPQGLRRIWSTHAAPDLWPLHYSYFWLTWRLWGIADTLPYHLVNLLLHGVVSLLFYAILRRLQVRGAALAAWLFAVHPVNTETVAWIVQFKTLSATAFAAGAALLFWRSLAPGRPRVKRLAYAGAWLLFLASLLCKSSLIFLPIGFLAVAGHREGWRRGLGKALPFLGLSLALGVAALQWYAPDAQLPPGDVLAPVSVAGRLVRAGWMFWFYVRQAFWPWHLAFIYPPWPPAYLATTNVLAYGPFAAALLLLFGAWRRGRLGHPTLLYALAYYFLALLPVLGFFSIYFLRFAPIADHWQYPALIAPLAWAVHAAWPWLEARAALGKRRTLAAASVLLLAWSSHIQTRRFVSEEALWRHALSVSPDSALVHNNLGKALVERGDYTAGAHEYAEALRLNPRFRDAYNNQGALFLMLGQPQTAQAAFQQALALWPDFATAHANLGVALTRAGQLEAALEPLQRATELSPDDASFHKNLAFTLLRLGRFAPAAHEYQIAVALEPSADHWNDLGQLWRQAGDLSAAQSALEQALRLQPEHALALANLGLVKSALGQPEAGLILLQRALGLEAHSAALHQALAAVYDQLGRHDDAAAELAAAHQLNAKSVP